MSTGWSLSYSPSFDNHNNDPDKPPAQAVRATTAATVSTAGGEGGTIIRIGKIHIHPDDGDKHDDDTNGEWCIAYIWCIVWCGIVWYGIVWYGIVWYGIVWYCIVWLGIFSYTRYIILLFCNGSDGLREVFEMEFLLHVTKSKYGIVYTLHALILCHNGSDCVLWYCDVMEAMV